MDIINRETVRLGGKWVARVSWADGPAIRPKSVTWTTDEARAYRFLPKYAAAIRHAYSPARAAERAAAEHAAVTLIAEAFASAMEHTHPDLAASLRRTVRR
jgi:hypothetical protein